MICAGGIQSSLPGGHREAAAGLTATRTSTLGQGVGPGRIGTDPMRNSAAGGPGAMSGQGQAKGALCEGRSSGNAVSGAELGRRKVRAATRQIFGGCIWLRAAFLSLGFRPCASSRYDASAEGV